MCFILIITRGSCAKWKSDWMRKEGFQATIPECFLCGLYRLNHNVCTLLITRISFLMLFKLYKWNEPSRSALDTNERRRKRWKRRPISLEGVNLSFTDIFFFLFFFFGCSFKIQLRAACGKTVNNIFLLLTSTFLFLKCKSYNYSHRPFICLY